jgi:hypothetical protein
MKLAEEGKVQPAGTHFLGLVDSLIDLFNQPGISHVEVIFVHFKLDAKGEKIVENKMNVAEINAMAITGISPEIQEELRKKSEQPMLISQMILWRDAANPGGLGIAKFRSVEAKKEYEDWEKNAILSYYDRNKP